MRHHRLRQRATLIMHTGEEVQVEVESEELDRHEFVLYRVGPVEGQSRATPEPLGEGVAMRGLGEPEVCGAAVSGRRAGAANTPPR